MTTHRRIRVDGIAHFPESLPVSADALGVTVDTRIGKNRVKLTLPIEDSGGIGMPLAPPRNALGVEIPAPLAIFGDEWGMKVGADVYMIGAARASFLVTLPSENNKLPEDLRDLGDQFFLWFDTVYNWASTWSNLQTRKTGAVRPDAFHFVGPKSGRLTGSATHISVVMSNELRPLSRAQVESACSKASKGIRLPAEHRLLMQAGTSLNDRDYRQAVIDAGTAAEVALATTISESLRSKKLNADYIENSIVHADGLAGLISTYVWLGYSLPVSKNRASAQLASVRNKAAHAAYIPSPQEAVGAIGIARALVNHARPLPLI